MRSRVVKGRCFRWLDEPVEDRNHLLPETGQWYDRGQIQIGTSPNQ